MLKRFQTFLRTQNNADVLKRQKLLLMIVAGLGLTLVYFFIFGGEEPKPSSFKKKEIKKVDIQSGGKRVDPQEVWKYKIEEEGQGLKKDLSELRSMISDQLSASDLKLNEENTFLKEKIQSLEDKFEAAELQKKMGGAIGSHHSVNPSGNQPRDKARDQARDQQAFNSNGFQPFHQNGFEGEESFGSSTLYGGIQKISLALGGNSSKEQIKTVDNTIPAGSFAKAVLLVGVDASTAMNASSDPRPMLLRIVDFGSLPRRFKSDLKDCRCTASAYGDISSERVYVRLEKLTCVERETGEIIETQVAGHVAGSDGRVGIRGKVVSKDAAYLGRGLMSGVLGGLSSIASPSKTPNMTIGLGTSTVEAQSRGELFSSGVASGSAQALDRLSNYYIDRAEQLQPVIQVSAGQFADVIFTEGVSVGDTNVKREISKVRDAARLKAAERLGQSADSRGLGFHQRSNH